MGYINIYYNVFYFKELSPVESLKKIKKILILK